MFDRCKHDWFDPTPQEEHHSELILKIAQVEAGMEVIILEEEDFPRLSKEVWSRVEELRRNDHTTQELQTMLLKLEKKEWP